MNAVAMWYRTRCNMNELSRSAEKGVGLIRGCFQIFHLAVVVVSVSSSNTGIYSM